MALVRVVWTGKGLLKRSSVTGPSPSIEKTLLTKAGVNLKRGAYLLNWVLVGETGETVSLSIEEQSGETWMPRAKTGPHTIPNDSDRVDSDLHQPPGYQAVTFMVSA